MENYIINNKTIGLLKLHKKTMIISVDKVEVFNISINRILEYNCNYYGASLKGRRNSAKNILKIQYKVPIIIDDKNNLIIIQLNSPRNKVSLFLVTNKIINYENYYNFLKIYCCNNVNFKVKISKNIFEKLIIKSIQLNNILNWRKSINLL